MLNAMTLPSHAVLKDTLPGQTREVTTQPFTNYNVSVIDKSLKNNSYVSLINSNMVLANNPFMANVTATEFEVRNKSQDLCSERQCRIQHQGRYKPGKGFHRRTRS